MTSTWIIFTLISLASGLGIGYMIGKSKRDIEYIPVEASEEATEVYIDTTQVTRDSARVQSEKKYMETQLRIKLETERACKRIDGDTFKKIVESVK